MKTMIAWLGAAVIGLAAAAAPAQTAMPQFQVDPLWPKPLPNNWLFGQIGGVAPWREESLRCPLRERHPAS